MTVKRAKPLKSSDREWVKTRRELLRHVKHEVRKRLGGAQDDISDFNTRYEKELKKRWSVSSQEELISQIEKSDLVYGGDFHALAQAQRTHLRLLRVIQRPVVIALECFQISAQPYLDAFLKDQITLEELRDLSKWERSWGFSWDHYRPLFELAKARGHELLALNSKAKTLSSREERAATTLTRKLRSSSKLVYVIFGDLHLAPEHLPGRVREKLKKPRRELTIHLNSERIYFQLAERGLEADVDVVKFNETSFCVLSTPPWVKWQSYLLFLDQAARGLDGDDRIDDETDFDATDQVALLVRLAASDLGLKKEFSQIGDLAVYGEDDEAIWRQVSKRTAIDERETAQALLRSGLRFFFPEGGIGYLPKPTINAAAAIAGLYLHARLSKRKRTLWRFPEDMRALVWTEGISYLISKMINHSRRSETVQTLHRKLKAKDENVEALRLALDVRLSEVIRYQTGRKRALQIQPRRKSSPLEAARILGGMLGERLFEAYRSRKLKKETLVKWLKVDPGSRGFSGQYNEMIETIARY